VELNLGTKGIQGVSFDLTENNEEGKGGVFARQLIFIIEEWLVVKVDWMI
jgi:hypothetical protein